MRDFTSDILMARVEVLTFLVPFGMETTLRKNAEVVQVEIALIWSAESNAILGSVHLKTVAQNDGRICDSK